MVMGHIHHLDEPTRRLLSSAQHITDTVSLVKELIDNSLDAGAKSISVEISADAIDYIQVRDNGHGVPAAEVDLLARPACTSKIISMHDLESLGGRYLGFRGMALSSMARVSGTMEFITRVDTEPVGVHAVFNQKGEVTSRILKACNPGSTVTIKNFLSTLPVRQKSVRKEGYRKLDDIKAKMQGYAIARPSVNFSYSVRGKGQTSR